MCPNGAAGPVGSGVGRSTRGSPAAGGRRVNAAGADVPGVYLPTEEAISSPGGSRARLTLTPMLSRLVRVSKVGHGSPAPGHRRCATGSPGRGRGGARTSTPSAGARGFLAGGWISQRRWHRLWRLNHPRKNSRGAGGLRGYIKYLGHSPLPLFILWGVSIVRNIKQKEDVQKAKTRAELRQAKATF